MLRSRNIFGPEGLIDARAMPRTRGRLEVVSKRRIGQRGCLVVIATTARDVREFNLTVAMRPRADHQEAGQPKGHDQQRQAGRHVSDRACQQ